MKFAGYNIQYSNAVSVDGGAAGLLGQKGHRLTLVIKDKLIDTSVKGICEGLNLRRPIYGQTSAYGHFGKPDLPWEQIVKS